MELNYDFNIKDSVFEYKCNKHSSYIDIRAKDIKKIYEILNRLNSIQEQALTTGRLNIVYGDFTIVFNFEGNVKIKNISNWLSIEQEVPIIKKELSKYIKNYNVESVKDIIVKIKYLKREVVIE